MRKPREGRLEFERFVHRLVHELLDDRLAPRPERAAAEAAGETFDAREPDALYFTGVAVEHADSVIDENLLDLAFGAGLEIVIPEDGHDRNPDRDRQVLHEITGFVGGAVVGDIASQHEDVGTCRNLRQQGLQQPVDDLPKCRSAVAAIRMRLVAATYVPSGIRLACATA